MSWYVLLNGYTCVRKDLDQKQISTCYDNSMLFLEVLRQLVFVLLSIVKCDVIRSSPLMFGRRRKSTERAVHATVCYPRGTWRLDSSGGSCGQKPFR